MLLDVSQILASKQYVLVALSDLYTTLGKALDQIDAKTSKALHRVTKLAHHKTLFFLAWSKEKENVFFCNLQVGVEDEWKRQRETLQSRTKVNESLPKTVPQQEKKSPIIQEL